MRLKVYVKRELLLRLKLGPSKLKLSLLHFILARRIIGFLAISNHSPENC
jgi:hypothetical protein